VSIGYNWSRRIDRRNPAVQSQWSGHFSFMKGKLQRYLSAQEHLDLGTNLAWYPGFTYHVIWAALGD